MISRRHKDPQVAAFTLKSVMSSSGFSLNKSSTRQKVHTSWCTLNQFQKTMCQPDYTTRPVSQLISHTLSASSDQTCGSSLHTSPAVSSNAIPSSCTCDEELLQTLTASWDVHLDWKYWYNYSSRSWTQAILHIPNLFRTVNLRGEQHMYQFWRYILWRGTTKPLMSHLSFIMIRPLLILVIKGDYAPRFVLVLCPHSRAH